MVQKSCQTLLKNLFKNKESNDLYSSQDLKNTKVYDVRMSNALKLLSFKLGYFYGTFSILLGAYASRHKFV